MQGFRLEQDRYRQIPLEPDGSLVSQTTGLRIQPEGTNLRLIDLATGERYPWAEESAAQAREAKAHAQEAKASAEREAAARRVAEEQVAQEAAARKAAEDEIARLRAEIERLKASR